MNMECEVIGLNNISVILWRSVLLMEETRGPGEHHLPAASHWQTLSHNVVHFIEIRTRNISGSCKSRTRRPPFFFKEINMYNNIMLKLYSFTLILFIYLFLSLHCWYYLLIVLQHYMIKLITDLWQVSGFLP
jgi:hypothetical protein